MIDRAPLFHPQPNFSALISDKFHIPSADPVLPLSTPEGARIGAELSAVLLVCLLSSFFIGSRRSKRRK